MPQTAPYGSWRSPITAKLIVSETVGLNSPRFDRSDAYWLESRPAEKGRVVAVRRGTDGKTEDVTPPEFSVRTRVHEYGGGAYTVLDGTIYFSNFADQRVYRQRSGGQPEPLTAEGPWRYADLIVDSARRRLICVREDHSSGGEPDNRLVSIGLDTGADGPGITLAAGHDFYASPCLSADGSHLAWLTWDHPNMPWDNTSLWVARVLDDGTLEGPIQIAGGRDESVFQPVWGANGSLYYVSDPSGWWNLFRWRDGRIDAHLSMEAEFGLPQWVFGMSTYALVANGSLVCAYSQNGNRHLARIDSGLTDLQPIETPFTSIESVASGPGGVVFIAGAPTLPEAVFLLDPGTHATQALRESSGVAFDTGYLSVPEAIAFPTPQGHTAHALFYPPCNRDYAGPADQRPPLIVRSHGGPTAAAPTTMSLAIQYWTSRGFAVVDVNYGGSTGYGRAYRQRLNGKWGVVDVDDCVSAAEYLADAGKADPERLAIRGSSAGGYTTLAALTFRDVFRAGASLYGISDLETLTTDTHKFESRYLDRLVGPLPEARSVYRDRSPIHYTDRLSAPVIFLQGLEDKVVPPDQAEKMVATLRRKGLPVAYLAFEGEQHGFRQAATIRRALEAELYFYGRIFRFAPADSLPAIPIENLPGEG
ncbi:MAG: S9 family peptidase [Gammaproteobacteria bacterium]|nr:S9 family peptidase [Gammaproteobacteria bacterium]